MPTSPWFVPRFHLALDPSSKPIPIFPIVLVKDALALVVRRQACRIPIWLTRVRIAPTGAALRQRAPTAAATIILATIVCIRAGQAIAVIVHVGGHLPVSLLGGRVGAGSIRSMVGLLARPVLVAEKKFPLPMAHELLLVDGNGAALRVVTTVRTLAAGPKDPLAHDVQVVVVGSI